LTANILFIFYWKYEVC